MSPGPTVPIKSKPSRLPKHTVLILFLTLLLAANLTVIWVNQNRLKAIIFGNPQEEIEAITVGVSKDSLAFSAPTNLSNRQEQFRTALQNSIDSYKANDTRNSFASAEEALELAETNEEKARAHHMRGLIFYLRQTSEALSRAEEQERLAIELDPSYSDPYVTLAAIVRDQGNFELALTYAEKAVELNPSNAYAHNNAGILYLEFARVSEAVAALTKAVELDPTNEVFKNNLERALNPSN